MISWVDQAVFLPIGLQSSRVVFSEANDNRIQIFKDANHSNEKYNTFHLFINKSISFEYLKNDELIHTLDMANGDYREFNSPVEKDSNIVPYHLIGPDLNLIYDKSLDSDSCKITSYQAGGSFLCIMPTNRNTDTVKLEVFNLEDYTNKVFVTQTKRLYVSNIDLDVDGKEILAYKPFASVFRRVEVWAKNPNETGKIAGFYI